MSLTQSQGNTPPVPAPSPDPAGEVCILIIDDTQAIHQDFRKVLCKPDQSAMEDWEAELFGDADARATRSVFRVDSAYQGQDGVRLLESATAQGRRYAMAFVDVRMPPGWDGVETTERLWAIDPDLQIVICTAYSDYSWDDLTRRFGVKDSLVILKKPFDAVEVLQLAHALAEKWRLAQESKQRFLDLNETVLQRTLEQEELEAQLRHSQKIEALGLLAGGVAHDFNNLLAVIRMNAELVMMSESAALGMEARACLEQVTEAVDRAANLTRQLLTFGRRQIMQIKPLSLNELIANLTKMLVRLIGEHIRFECRLADALPNIQADGGMMEQVITNLVINARDAMPDGGRLLLTTEAINLSAESAAHHVEARAGNFVCLSISDTGRGINPEHMAHIFEPFFTTKEVGKGSGLGLATAYGIVKQHQGWIAVSSHPGQGADFKVYLPATDAQVQRVETPVGLKDHLRGSETILLVEDEEAVRFSTRRVLASFGYQVHEAGCGREALDRWGARISEIDLLLTDMIMPNGLSGRELIERLKAVKPTLKAVIMSGYSGEQVLQDADFLRTYGGCFLQKPCNWRELAQAIRSQLDN